MSSTPHRSNLKVLPAQVTDNLWLAYDSFILSLQAAHRTPRTIEYYHEKLRPFVIWLEASDRPPFSVPFDVLVFAFPCGGSASQGNVLPFRCSWRSDHDIIVEAVLNKPLQHHRNHRLYMET